MSLSITSFNCRGLQGLDKRRDVLNYLKQKQNSIYFLQDTHFTKDDTNIVRSIWGYDTYTSPGKNDSRGVAILFNNNFEFKTIHVTPDEMGNLLAIELKIEKYNILLINIYGPNRDSPEFYEKLQSIIELFYGDFVISNSYYIITKTYIICS